MISARDKISTPPASTTAEVKPKQGFRALLAIPALYTLFENILGAARTRQIFLSQYLRPTPGMRLLDLGCGPADIVGLLPRDVDYTGCDSSSAYIAIARKRFEYRARFVVADVSRMAAPAKSDFDAVTAIFLLHHLDDDACERVLALAATCLRPGGRFLAIDPCLVPGQSRIARWLILHDRGSYVRSPDQYAAIASRYLKNVRIEVRHDLLRIPYTHCVLTAECKRNTNA